MTTFNAEKHMRIATNKRAGKEHGFVLIAALFMLIILTFMAVGLYHNFTMQQSMAGNSKEKGRAFQLAQSTLQYGEYELASNLSNLGVSQACTTTAPPSQSILTICQGSTGPNIVNPTASGGYIQMLNGWTYTPTTVADVSTTALGSNSYFNDPQLFIRYLGSSGNGQIYQVTALAYGATNGAVAAVQSTYQLTSTTVNLGNP
jgi:type IV pilus assembly protein PilX